MSALRLSRAALPLLRAAGGGAIVNISAADGLEPTLMFPIGGSMRAALSALTKLLARRLGGDRIRVNSVLPWVVLDPTSEWRSEEIPLSRAAHPCRDRAHGFLPVQSRGLVPHGGQPPGRRRLVAGIVERPTPAPMQTGCGTYHWYAAARHVGHPQ